MTTTSSDSGSVRAPKQKRSFLKIFLVMIGGLFALLIVASWIFFTFFFEDILNSKVTPRLTAGVETASRGKYTLKLGHISYSHGELLGRNIRLYRLRYDSSEVGIVVRRVQIDTVLFSGIDWWSLALGRGLYMSEMQIRQPKVYLTDANEEESSGDLPADDSVSSKSLKLPTSLPKEVPVISVGKIEFSEAALFLPKDTLPTAIRVADSALPWVNRRHPHPTFDSVSFTVTDLLLDAKSLQTRPLFFSKRVEFTLPSIHYDLGGGIYSVNAKNMHGILTDSTLSFDSIWYASNFSHDEFASKFKYPQGELDFRCGDVSIRGIDFTSLLTARGIAFRALDARRWHVFFYVDKRKPVDPHPPIATLPNEMVSDHPFAIDLDSVILGDGHIGVSERMPGSERAGLLTFEHAKVSAIPFSTDSLSPRFGVPTHIDFDAYFVGAARVRGSATYPMQHKSFDLDVDATVGGFSALKLNAWLVTNERIQVETGELESGAIKMRIRNGVGTTSVTPKYKDLALKMLNSTPGKSRGILEGIKTFMAKIFVVRGNNLDENGKPALTGTTTRRRDRTEEFMQFIWLALRKSLGKVVGGFD